MVSQVSKGVGSEQLKHDATSKTEPLPSQSPVLGDGPGSSSSKDKSSLQSSFDADHSGIRHLYSQFGGGAASLRNMDGQGMDEQLLLATEQLDDDDQFAGRIQASQTTGGPSIPGLPGCSPDLSVPPQSPFAAAASVIQEWEEEGWQKGKRKCTSPDQAPRSRRRTLDFGSPKKQEARTTEIGSVWQGNLPKSNLSTAPLALPAFNLPPRLPAFTNSSLGIDIPQHRFKKAGYFGSCVLGGLPADDSPGALSNAFAAALGSGYIPPGGAATALPLGPASNSGLNYSCYRPLGADIQTSYQPPAQEGQKCNCKKSRCLKLYCVCFAAGQFCLNCTCANCSNTPEYGEAVMETRTSILQRNQHAFDTKVKADAQDGVQHKKGCHCKKSNCKKKYCECFQAGVNCGSHCKCENCLNQPGDGPPEPRMPSSQRRAESGRASQGVAASTVENEFQPKKAVRGRKSSVKLEIEKEAPSVGPMSAAITSAPSIPQPQCSPPEPPTLETLEPTSMPLSPPAMLCNSQMGYQATGTTLLRKGMCMRDEGTLERPIATRADPSTSLDPFTAKGSFLEGDNEAALLESAASLDEYLKEQDQKTSQGGKGFLESLQAVSGNKENQSPSRNGQISQTPSKPTLLTDPLASTRAWSTGDLQQNHTLAAPYYQVPDSFDINELPIGLDGGFEDDHDWASTRIEDLGTGGHDNLDHWMLNSGDDLEKSPLLSEVMDATQLTGNADGRNLDRRPSPGFAGWTPSTGRKRKLSDVLGTESPLRFPLEPLTSAAGTTNRQVNPTRPVLAPLPSFDPLGIPAKLAKTTRTAIRKHCAAPPSLPNAERGYTDSFLQTMQDDGWLRGISGAHPAYQESSLENALSLQQSHSLPAAGYLPEVPGLRADKFGISPNRSNSMPYPGYGIKSEHAHRTLRQELGPSPKKLRINRISGNESANGFYKINSGMTTILSPPKLH